MKLAEDNFSSLPLLSVELKLLSEFERILNVFRGKKKILFVFSVFSFIKSDEGKLDLRHSYFSV